MKMMHAFIQYISLRGTRFISEAESNSFFKGEKYEEWYTLNTNFWSANSECNYNVYLLMQRGEGVRHGKKILLFKYKPSRPTFPLPPISGC